MTKKVITKVKLPLVKMSEKEKDYVAIILEEVRSNFAMFGETLSGFGDKLELVRQKGDATFEEVGRIKGDIVEMKGDIVGIKDEMKEMNSRLDRIEIEVSAIRNEIEMLKDILTKKTDVDYVQRLERRLERVEKHLELKIL